MSRIPFSEFTESELRIFISALEHYTKDMHKSAYIYDTCESLLDEMKFNLESRIKQWNEVLGEVIREPFSRPTKRAADDCPQGGSHVYKWDGTLPTDEMIECEKCGHRR